ncbi:MAG: hypothetical protein ABSC53_15960 [Bacteroidota bacterium]
MPQEHIAVGSAFRYDASRPLILSVSNQVDTSIAQLAGDEVIVEQGVGKHDITGFESAIDASEEVRFSGALAFVRRDGQIVASTGRQR